MMTKIKDKIENIHGGIDCKILIGTEWFPHTIDSELEYELDDSTEWQDVKAIDTELKAANTKEANRQAAKQVRDSALNALTYTFSDGRTLQTRPQDGLNIQTAIGLGEDIEFVCSDNSIASFTVIELQEAMTNGILQAKAVWSTYINSIR